MEIKNGTHGGTRTHNLQFRKLLLYPIELRAQNRPLSGVSFTYTKFSLLTSLIKQPRLPKSARGTSRSPPLTADTMGSIKKAARNSVNRITQDRIEVICLISPDLIQNKPLFLENHIDAHDSCQN